MSVLLFGFLLTSAESFVQTTLEEVLYSVSIVLVATATLVFVLPVAYHHLQFPYRDFEKFLERTHAWLIIGLPAWWRPLPQPQSGDLVAAGCMGARRGCPAAFLVRRKLADPSR